MNWGMDTGGPAGYPSLHQLFSQGLGGSQSGLGTTPNKPAWGGKVATRGRLWGNPTSTSSAQRAHLSQRLPFLKV